jgi:hypothetical protein
VIVTDVANQNGSAYHALTHSRKGIGVELKESYFWQAVRNMAEARRPAEQEVLPL